MTTTASTFAAPSWIHSFYSRFPLITLPCEDNLSWVNANDHVLWIAPTSSSTRSWASMDPSCLRVQLLFMLRGVSVEFKEWDGAESLPLLHLPGQNRLVPTEEIRSWLDSHTDLGSLQGLPDQQAYDRAVALGQLIRDRIHPASIGRRELEFAHPPPLAAGLVTPLPAALTGNARVALPLHDRAEDAWNAVEEVIAEDGWAFKAASPTPVDALIAAYGFQLGGKRVKLQDYVERVLDWAERMGVKGNPLR